MCWLSFCILVEIALQTSNNMAEHQRKTWRMEVTRCVAGGKQYMADLRQHGFKIPILRGILPIKRAQVPADIIAGITLAALAIPEVIGYTKISGTPLISGLYTIFI